MFRNMGAAGASSLPRFAAMASLLITLVGFIVLVAGLSELQKQTNHFGDIQAAGLTDTYQQTFNNVLLPPYPTDHHFQFSWIWFVIFGQLFVLVLCAIVLMIPAFHSGRGACLTLLAVMGTLAITVVNNATYLHKNAGALASFYKKSYINTTYAGVLLVVIGNVFTILAMGFWEPWRALIAQNSNYYGTNKAAAPAAPGVATAETRV